LNDPCQTPRKAEHTGHKTTIEIPDAIVHQAKIIAAERQTTLRGLVLQGLEHILAEK
jgi:hypothetical protein